MANEQNLVPFTSNQSREEAKKNGRKGGIKSGEARRRNAALRETMNRLLTMKVNVEGLSDVLEADGVESTYEDVISMAMIEQAAQGDVKAYNAIKATVGQTSKSELDEEEQRAKIQLMNAQAEKASPRQDDEEKEVPYNGIPATMIAPVFAPVLFDIREHKYTEYVFPGGRGSTKSSFISTNVIDLIMANPDMHAVVMRQVADTLRGSVYQQMLWAIEALGLSDEFHATVSPMEITRKSTGQKIYFRGADDPGKIKSIKVPFGYIGVLWFEELDQFVGPEAVRKIEQSVIRGGDVAYIFKSFNPPKSASNWANKYIKIPKATRIVVWSNYTQVPAA